MKKNPLCLVVVLLILASCQPNEMAPSPPPVVDMAPCPDCNQPGTCTETDQVLQWNEAEQKFEMVDYTFSIPCGTGGGDGPPPPPTTYPGTPAMYCGTTFPPNPTNGTVVKVSTAGSSCLSPVYYYSCSGSGWVVPVNAVYGTPPKSPYNGLRYQANYNDTYITYVFLTNFAGYSGSWYYLVADTSSTGCTTVLPES